MPKAIGNQTFNLAQNDKVSRRVKVKFENKSAAPGKAKPEAAEPEKKPVKYKTRKR